MDFETELRQIIKSGARHVLDALYINDENRVVFSVNGGKEFVVFGDKTAPYSPKPPTQKVTIPGLDSFKPMGSR